MVFLNLKKEPCEECEKYEKCKADGTIDRPTKNNENFDCFVEKKEG